MPRSVGDKNFSPREQRLAAELAAAKAKYEAKLASAKAQAEVQAARIRELKARKK